MTQDTEQLQQGGFPLTQPLDRETVYRVLLGAADLVSASLAVVLAVAVLGDDRLNAVALLVVPAVLLISKAGGLYDRDEPLLRRATLDEAGALFRAATLYTTRATPAGSAMATPTPCTS
jgi:hypothetical protein